MRLLRAELLKIRRRQATYVVLFVAVVLMVVIFLVTGSTLGGLAGAITFPAAYALIGEFVFSIGGLMAVVYAAAYVGSDWNWGVLRNVVARGESRTGYLLSKTLALIIVLGIAMLILFAVGIAMTYFTGLLYGIPVSNPLSGNGLSDLAEWLFFGFPVLVQRAALGLVVAVVLRSQLAGAVVGIVLYVGEAIITTTLTFAAVASSFGGGFDPEGPIVGFEPIGPEWFQFLPISIGGNVLSALPGGSTAGASGGLEDLFLKPVPFELALPIVLVYLVVSIGIAVFALRRQEIV